MVQVLDRVLDLRGLIQDLVADGRMKQTDANQLLGTSRRFDERLTVALLLMREKLTAPALRPTHPGFAYRDGDFGPLAARVEQGPETWDEEARQAREALYAEYPPEEDEDEEYDDWLDD